MTKPTKETTVNGTPSPGKRNVKAKRLLPMELRKRRRAAKLQVSAEKKAKVTLEEHQTLLQSARSPGKDKELEKESSRDSVADTPATSTNEATPAATASTRLHSLYTSSLLGQKKRQLVPGANVPHTFQVAELPLDIVPKIKLSILTAFPYPFQRINSKIKTQALQNFISGSENAKLSASRRQAVRWQQALHYFVHPADPVPTSILVNRAAASTSEPLLGGTKGERKREEKGFFTTRWNTWQESFRDVYMSFRRHTSSRSDDDTQDGSFYLCSSEFVVYFLYDNDSQGTTRDGASIINLCRQYDEETEGLTQETKRIKHHCLRAVMSQSSTRIRKVLHHLNVSYTMPYIKANETQREVGEFHLLEEELEASRKRNKERNGATIIAPVTSTASIPENMHGADSLLLFHGHDAVHGLYEFLINQAPMSNQDVPELYALHPFANASIQSLQVRSFGRVGAAASESEDQTSRSSTLFRIEVLGFCFPSSVARLLAVLKDEWEATHKSYGTITLSTTEVSTTGGKNAQVAVRTYMEAMAGAERLNAVKLDEQIAQGPNENRDDQQERQKRQQELEFSKRRMEIAVVTKVDSRYNVETTTTSIVGRR